MFSASWKLSAAVWPLLVVGSLQAAKAGARRAGQSAHALAAAREEALAFADERLQHRDLARWFGRADTVTEEFRQKCSHCVAVCSKAARGRAVAHLVFDFIAKGLMLGLASFGSSLVQRGELSAGELTSFFFHASFLGLGLYGLVGLVPELSVARAAAKRLADVVNEASGKPASLRHQAMPSPSVRFEDVHFSYSPEKAVLKGFSLEVAAGQTVAIVGPSGCGKSTVLALLLRDFDVGRGRILVGDQDVTTVSRQQLRNLLGVVPQHAVLLGASVADAIRFGSSSPTEIQVEAAARSASAHHFVSLRPGGYSSPVGRGGQLLSGGERQRLSMARAFLRDAPVLVLDEPTSALDTATAAAISEAILTQRPNRPTTLVVTHSLALIRSCDGVAVLSTEGRVVQRGTFSELVADTSGALVQMLKAGGLEDDITPS